ncbi:protein FAM177B [Ixodes scapularis]
MAEVTPVHFSATNGINVELSRPTEINESPAPKPNMPQFSEVPLNKDCVSAKIKSPRKVLHFSDGVLEEYSSEDESEALVPDTSNLTVADPKTMSWFPYFFHLALQMGTKALAVCDYLGEHLAYFFGITSPKYQYELEEYQKMVQEEEEEKRREAEQMAGWRSAGDAEIGVTTQPGAAPLPNSTQRSADVPLQHSANVPLTSTPATPDQQSMQWQRY